MEALLAAFRSLGPARILALFIGLSATVFITGLVVSRLNTPGYALLYGGLDVQETSSITQYLGSQNIPYETRGDGAVYVPADQVGQLRLSVAGQGLVGSSNAGYELFDNTSTFGTTNFVQNLNARRALEGELARTISTIPAIAGARVHIVMPKQNIFSSQQIVPSAAVALNVGTRTLDASQVGSIAQLVAAAIPNLTSDHITIIDQRGTLLFDGKTSPLTSSATTMREKVENQYEAELTTMLERAVGIGKVAVQVTAQVNTEEIEESSEIYDPTQQVVRSEQLVEVANNSANGGGASPVGVQGNIPGDTAAGGSAGSSNSAENRTETTTNYEIGRTVRQRKVPGGQVEKLSVAVLIEGKTAENSNGEMVYTPYSEGDLTRFRRLVESAIGYDSARGDQVEIADMQFSTPDEISTADAPLLTKEQIIQFVEYGLLLVALLLVAFMVVRPTLTLLTSALGTSLPPSALPPLQATGPIGGEGGQAGSSITGAPAPGESTIDISQVRGRVKESSVKKVNEIIDQHPEESLNVVRNWMAQDGSRSSGGDDF